MKPRISTFALCSTANVAIGPILFGGQSSPMSSSRKINLIIGLFFRTWQWLPIDKRIKFKILLHIYKALNDLSPVYLTECIAIHLPSREGLRSSVDTTRLVVPRSTRRIGDRSFSVYGPSLWNQLPISIRSSSTVCNFKHSLKTHMF